LKQKIDNILKKINIPSILSQAEYEFRRQIPIKFDRKNNNEPSFSGKLSLNEKCDKLSKEIANSNELKRGTDVMDLLDRCPKELYDKIIRDRISKLNYA